MRKTEFANGEYYHIFNRGVDKRDVFMCAQDYERFLLCMNLLNDKKDGIMAKWKDIKKLNPRAQLWDFPELSSGRSPLVEYSAYCLNFNHYHFILKQIEDKGIERFMHKLSTGYTNYFNKKYERSGTLFQGRYKSVHINSNEYLLYLSAYINKNHSIHRYPEGDDWAYSSLWDYTGKRDGSLCEKEIILGQFDNNRLEYQEYMDANANFFKENKELEKLTIE